MIAVAAVAHEVIGFVGGGVVLGAIVSPTDPLAATEIGAALGVPRRPLAIIEGESLVNDGTALVLFKFAVAAVVTGTFSLLDAAASLVWTVVGGIAIGLVVGHAIRRSCGGRLDNPPLEVTDRVPHRLLRVPARERRSARRACSRSSPRASTWAGTRPS